MAALRFIAIFWAVVCLVGLCFAERGIPSMILAGIFLTLFLFICWTFGAFTPSDHNSRKAHHD